MKRSKNNLITEQGFVQIQINKALDSVEDTLFFKKKMEKGAKILAVAGLPAMPK